MTRKLLTILALLATAMLHAQMKQGDISNGMVNPDFELGEPGEVPQGWGWFHPKSRIIASRFGNAQQLQEEPVPRH